MRAGETGAMTAALQRLAADKGDEKAWQDLCVETWPFAFALCFRLMRGNREKAEDVAQEVFLRLLKYCEFGGLQDGAAFRAYLSSICRNTARDYATKLYGQNVVALDSLIEAGADLVRPSSWTPEDQARVNERLKQILGELDGEDRDLLRLIVEGYSLPEIVQRLPLSYSATAVRVHRLRKRLRQYLEA